MVNYAPQWQVFLVCMNVSCSQVGQFSFLLCFCLVNMPTSNFCCLVPVHLSLGLEVAPTTCMDFRRLATFVPVEFRSVVPAIFRWCSSQYFELPLEHVGSNNLQIFFFSASNKPPPLAVQ